MTNKHLYYYKNSVKNIISYCLLAFFLAGIGGMSANSLFAKKPFKKSLNLKKLKEGDIIFQRTRSEQARAVKIATNSKYTHVGIIFKINKKWVVFEAVQPLRYVSLRKFINHGIKRHYIIKRLNKSFYSLSNKQIEHMKKVAYQMKGRDYDPYFSWDEKRIYCSELVWKLYKRAANVELSKLRKLKNYRLNHPTVRKLMKKRYGKNIPYNESVVSPADLLHSKYLNTVY